MIMNKSYIKNEFTGIRILSLIVTFCCAVIVSASIYEFNYLQTSQLRLILSNAFIIVLFTAFYYLLNLAVAHSNTTAHKKDTKLFIIMLSSLFLFSCILYPIIRSVGTYSLYNRIEASIINSYDGKSPTNLNFVNFKKDKDANNVAKISYYNDNKDDLISVDTNMVMNLMLIKENIKDITVKNKINEIYGDKFISKTEYNSLKAYILNNPNNDDAVLAQLVSR